MTRSWWENEEIIDRFRAWLSETDAEINALDAADDEFPQLDDQPQFDDEPKPDDQPPFADQSGLPAEPLPAVGLQQLVEAFTALRHELKLQTKSGRGLEDATQSALQGLESARRQFQAAQAREQEAAERAALPLVEAIVGLDEALSRGAQAFRATHQQMTQSAPLRLRETLDDRFRALPWWRRWLAASWQRQVGRLCGEAFAQTNEREFASLMEGYALIRTRMGRVLRDHEIERIDCVGQPVDPGRMTVVELVDDPAAVPETVVQEVRPGYVWRERVIRYAEVRAVRSESTAVANLPDSNP